MKTIEELQAELEQLKAEKEAIEQAKQDDINKAVNSRLAREKEKADKEKAELSNKIKMLEDSLTNGQGKELETQEKIDALTKTLESMQQATQEQQNALKKQEFKDSLLSNGVDENIANTLLSVTPVDKYESIDIDTLPKAKQKNPSVPPVGQNPEDPYNLNGAEWD